MSDQRKIYLNKPQRRAFLVNAHEQYHVWGRGTGKTEGPIAFRSIHNQNIMPRGASGLVAATYVQILIRTLPPLERAWQRYGYMPGVHYWVNQYPPKNLKIPKAIFHPRSPEHHIFWWNGHVVPFMSLDRPGLSNGKSVDAMFGDEAKLLNYQRYLDDIAPTNRGNRDIFGHLSEHHAVTFCTDMPESQSGKWILEKEREMSKTLVTQIINLQLAYNELELQAYHPKTTASQKQYLLRKMKNYASALNELRRGSVFYSEATSLENIEILGEDQFRQWKREMMPHVYERAILNKRILQVEKGFYPLLNLDNHTYDEFDYSHIDNVFSKIKGFTLNGVEVKQNSLFDADINRAAPLDIAYDCNGYFNCCVIGQAHTAGLPEYRVLNAMFVKDLERLEELNQDVIEYYRHHPTKELNFYYDHTFVWTDSSRVFSYADMIERAFRAAGWKVNMFYIGQQPGHDTRYRMWGNVMKEQDRRYVRVRINKTNGAQLLIALQRTAARNGKNGVEKDKREEGRIHTVPQEEAPHLTDAFDTIYIGKHQHQVGYEYPITDLLIA
jgi:hypothetical protein